MTLFNHDTYWKLSKLKMACKDSMHGLSSIYFSISYLDALLNAFNNFWSIIVMSSELINSTYTTWLLFCFVYFLFKHCFFFIYKFANRYFNIVDVSLDLNIFNTYLSIQFCKASIPMNQYICHLDKKMPNLIAFLKIKIIEMGDR